MLHSHQGHSFESLILREALKALRINTLHTTAYHLQEDGSVEHFNCSLLQML